MWQRQIQRSGAVGRIRAQAGRLRVVDDDHVPVVVEALRVHRVVGLEHLPLLVGDRLRVALQGVVHQLGDVEELLAAEDHLPVGVEADVAHQRHERVEDLRDAAAERGGAHVQHPLARERLGQLADLLDQATARRGACSRPATVDQGRRPASMCRQHSGARVVGRLAQGHARGGRCRAARSPSRSRGMRARRLAAATHESWNSAPEPSSGRAPSGPP